MATDRLPDVIHAYFKAIDDRDLDSLNSLIADDALIATLAGGAGDPRLVRTGLQLRREMASRDPVPWLHRVVDIHVHGAGALVEGELVRQDVGTKDRFVVFFAVDGEGRVAGLISFQLRDTESGLSVEERQQWSGLVERVLDDQNAPDAPSVEQAVALMSDVGAPSKSGLSVAWRTPGTAPVAVVGRLGRFADFAAVVRTEVSGAVAHVEAAWGPLPETRRA